MDACLRQVVCKTTVLPKLTELFLSVWLSDFCTWMDREILRISDALLVLGLAGQDFLTTQHLFLNKGKLKVLIFVYMYISEWGQPRVRKLSCQTTEKASPTSWFSNYSKLKNERICFILSSSTITLFSRFHFLKILSKYTLFWKISKILSNFESIFEKNVNFKSIFEKFVLTL